MDEAKLLIVGANGQLGTALQAKYPGARAVDSAELDITNSEAVRNFDWSNITTIINAAAYTNVDGAETNEGRPLAWGVNAVGVRNLVEASLTHNLVLFHISSEYVFDGTQDPHSENEPFSPLGVYACSKAAGDIAVSLAHKHYLLRTSWVIGEGKNFVRTMVALGQKGIAPTVVADQVGRLTFTSELVRVIDHFLHTSPDYGTYNVSNSGDPGSWADITREIFKHGGFDLKVTDISTAEYFAGKPESSPRPLKSILSLSKLELTGFDSKDWREDLKQYVNKELAK